MALHAKPCPAFSGDPVDPVDDKRAWSFQRWKITWLRWLCYKENANVRIFSAVDLLSSGERETRKHFVRAEWQLSMEK